MTKKVTNGLKTFENLTLLYFTGKRRLVKKTVWGSKNKNLKIIVGFFDQRNCPKDLQKGWFEPNWKKIGQQLQSVKRKYKFNIIYIVVQKIS